MEQDGRKDSFIMRLNVPLLLLWCRRLLFAGVCLAMLVALFYVIENVRGKCAWSKYQRACEAKGDRFEWSAIMPSPVPDDQNIAAAPIFAELFPVYPQNYRLKAVKLPIRPIRAAGNWRLGRVENLDMWRTCLTNEDILAALACYAPLLKEVDAALQRPSWRFPHGYKEPLLAPLFITVPHNLASVYRLRALAEVAAGPSQARAAFDDVQACLRLADCYLGDPTLVHVQVRASLLLRAMQPIWEGLAARRWSDNQLSALQDTLARQALLEHLVLGIKGQRMYVYSLILMMLKDHRMTEVKATAHGTSEEQRYFTRETEGMAGLRPSGWLYQNALAIDRWYTERVLPAIDLQCRRIHVPVVVEAKRMPNEMRIMPYNSLFQRLVFPTEGTVKKVALAQTSADQAAAACAIERYRLVSGTVPEKLEALVPRYLAAVPRDVIDGQPLRYKRDGTEHYRIYSVGWNGTDDDGEVAMKSGRLNQEMDEMKGDWVWASQPR